MDDPGRSSVFGSILLILILTLINAFLAGAEMAFVSLNPSKMKERADAGDKRAKRVQKLLQEPDSFLSAIQVGITLAGFFNSASASQTFVGLLSPLLGKFPGAEAVAMVIVTLAIAYCSLVLGELYPKQLALQVPEGYALRAAGAILAIKAVFRPFIWLLNFSTGLLKRLTPIDFSKKEEKLTRQEMKALLSSSRNDGAIDAEEFDMMRGVLSLDSRLVREIMVPRVDANMLDADDPLEDNLAVMLEQLHSRVPLYEEDKDHIIGIVHLKDVLVRLDELRSGALSLRALSRPALFVPDTLSTDAMLVQFQKSKQHLAILVDEFGGVAGLVTLEDLIEEIVGDISDEYDDDAPVIQNSGEDSFILKGNLPLSDLNRRFGLKLQSEEADTIAGYLIERLGRIPEASDEAIPAPDCEFKVLEADETHIETLEMRLVGAPDPEND